MIIKPIRTKKDHQRALKRIESLMGASARSRAGEELEVLVTLVEAYEARHCEILPPRPIEAIRHRLEALGLSRKDLEPYLGSRARVSEILGGRRPLTLKMIRKLHRYLAIPAETLIAA